MKTQKAKTENRQRKVENLSLIHISEPTRLLSISYAVFCLKKMIMDTVILPAMTYGAETWSITKNQEKKLVTAQRSMERSVLNITRRDKIRNKIIREKTKVKDIMEKVNSMRGEWAGHIARMDTGRWARKTTEWTPREGKRQRGRPKRRWRDNIEEVAGNTWMRKAQDRRVWRVLWRPPASSGTTC